jgi:FolB domain-containing protein
MSDRILIDELRFRAIVGVHPWERELPQTLLVSLELKLSLSSAASTDDLSKTVDYDQLSKMVIRRARAVKRLTLEALAEDLANACLEEPKIEQVTVKVVKPRALRRARGVAVQISRARAPRASER